MKVPLIPLHVVTSGRLAQIRAAARAEGKAEGVAEEKRLSNIQIGQVL